MIKDVEPLLKECEETLKELMGMGKMEVACYVQGFINSINKLPDADQRPHGEWIPFEWDDKYLTKIPLPKGSVSHMEEYWDEEFMCSVCGKSHHARNFCPNCGADMRKEGDENE